MSSRSAPMRPHLSHLPSSAAARRRRRRRLLLPLLVGLVGVALAAAAVFVLRGDDDTDIGTRYAVAFAKGDYSAMYALISASDRRSLALERFTDLQQTARDTATVTKITTGLVTSSDDDRVRVPVTVKTELFGTLTGDLFLPVVKDEEKRAVDWSQALSFPGLRAGEKLRRTTTLPPRASILASDNTTMVRGDGGARVPSTDTALASIVGQVGPIPADQKADYAAKGVPADATVGLTGLERVFEDRVRGKAGGTLFAGDRQLAATEPDRASSIRTTINPTVQRAAVTALGNSFGGITAVRPSTGAIVALAGVAFSGLQPPGSTFKIVTTAAALRYGNAKPSTVYPVQTEATISGVAIQNADKESCGGTLTESFVHSCNSVYAPLGAKVGGKHLVETAEAFGFNDELGIPGAATSTIPAADEIGDDLAVGSSAIGQGRVQASSLQMALVAATIAERGERPELTLEAGRSPKLERVIPRTVASQVTTMMAAVVARGTGGAAGIDGVKVAGKTGTAELRSTQGECDEENPPEGGCPAEDDQTDTTAWFAGFAPASSPKIAVAVYLVGQGKGGDTAAPVFKSVATAALK
ncbi:MAG: penicillin-binding transpeptidase domain-containing protein [Solirubrobacteraceae bacterium]|nr:penicillin-binding transpeptidase domain-containing protein [Solirubrobacteraceae bacterium]